MDDADISMLYTNSNNDKCTDDSNDLATKSNLSISSTDSDCDSDDTFYKARKLLKGGSMTNLFELEDEEENFDLWHDMDTLNLGGFFDEPIEYITIGNKAQTLDVVAVCDDKIMPHVEETYKIGDATTKDEMQNTTKTGITLSEIMLGTATNLATVSNTNAAI